MIQWRSKKLLWSGAVSLLLIFGVVSFFLRGPAGRIAVGSKDFTEQVILGEILAQAIEAKTGLQVVRRFDLGGNLAHEALIAGELDLYVEYTGTALLAILKSRPLTDPQEVLRRVKTEYASRFKLDWTEPLGFNNTFAILVRGEDAKMRPRSQPSGAPASAKISCPGRMVILVSLKPTVFISRKLGRWICL